MQYHSVLNSIARGVLSPLYLFYGEEDYLQELLVKKLQDLLAGPSAGGFNYDELDMDRATPAAIINSASMLPLFAEKRLVVVKDPVFFKASRKEKEEQKTGGQEDMLLQYLNDPLLSTCLVFIVRGPVNKQKKLVKAIEKKGVLLELNTPKGQELISWVKEEAGALGLALEPQACEYLIMNAGYSMRVLRSELEKLALYAGSNNKVTLETAQELVAKSSEANIFTLVDSIGRKEGETALTELHHLITSGEPPVRILFMIARQFRLLLQAKDMKRKGCTERQITAALSLPAFVTVKILKQANNFNFSELEDCLQQMLECDLAMKTGSPPRQTLEDLVLNLVWHNRLGGMKNA